MKEPKTKTTPSSTASRSNSMKLVIVGLVIAVAAVILQNVHVEMVRRQARPNEFIVYRLETKVRPGDRLQRRDIKAVRMHEDFQEAFSDAVDETGLTTRLGLPFERSADRHAVLTYDLFIEPEDNNLDRMISKDMRLVALPVNARSIPGNLRPGMYVDIEAPFPARLGAGETGSSVTQLPGVPGAGVVLPVMERVKVLAVGRHSVVDEQESGGARSGGSFSTISIEVDPRQATQLSMIESLAIGDFKLHLRNPGDASQPKIPEGGINPEVLRLVGQSDYVAVRREE